MADAPGPRTLSVPLDWTMPALGRKVVPDGGRVDVVTAAESLTAYDTADADLAAAGVALHRVTGADGAQWRLRIGTDTSTFPADDPSARGVPADLRELLFGARAGAPLRIVNRTERSTVEHRVIDGDDAELGTVRLVRDRVARPSTRAAEVGESQTVEVAGWVGPFVDAATRRLLRRGAARVEEASRADAETVGDALSAFIREQAEAIVRADLDLRLGEDAVHRFRVAIRRLRSAVRVVDVSDVEQATRLDTELRWLSELLGQVRDRQVLREHLAPGDHVSADHDSGDHDLRDAALVAAHTHVERVLTDEETAARTALTTALSGRRYLALLRILREWRTTPPFTAAAEKPVGQLSRYTRDAGKQLEKRLGKAHGSADKLHRARKAAKRARYVADLAGSHAGKHGVRIAGHAKSLQTRLGDYQDGVVAAEFLHRAALTAPPAAAFGCGVLWEREQQRAAAAAAAAVR